MRKIINLYLIRHAQKEKVVGDPNLTQLGKIQAEKTAQYLNNYKIDRIFSSPAKRAIETSEIICKLLNTGYQVDVQLRERSNWGDDPRQSLDDFLKMWVKSSNERTWQPPIGDSSINAGNRMLNFINNLADKLDNNDGVVIVSHGGIIVDCLLNLFGNEYINKFSPNFVENRDALLSECSITKLNYDLKNKKFSLEMLAYTDHLK